jgi:hypothetical protein
VGALCLGEPSHARAHDPARHRPELAPLDIIRLDGWRFKIEVSFKQAIHTLGASERHIQLGLIAQGLLQYLGACSRRLAWFNFHSYIRTAAPEKPPSEWVVAQALRHTRPDFLANSPVSRILKKFLARKVVTDRCGYSAALELDKVA